MAVIRFTVVCSVLACMTACDKPTAPIDTGSGSPPPEPTVVVGVPTGWGSSSVGVGAVTPNPAYTVGIDKQNKRSGAAAAFMFANSEFPTAPQTLHRDLLRMRIAANACACRAGYAT